MQRVPIIVVAVTVIMGASPQLFGAEAPGAAVRPRAVVLVSVDTLRGDSVSCAGYRPFTTPHLDRMANDGVVFTDAYATSSWTPPSMGSLVTGLYPSSHGVTTGGIQKRSVIAQPVLSDTLTTIAEVFKRAGYTTIGVPANRHLMASLGFAQGFDHYYHAADFLTAKELNVEVRRILEDTFGPEWQSAWKASPTFLWIHYFDPHDPYFARRPWINSFAPDFAASPEAYPNAMVMRMMHKLYPQPDATLASRMRPLYDSEIAYWDHHFGQLAAELGLDDPDLLLVVTSDHGEEFVEHGGIGHSQSLYEELVRVPMVVRWPTAISGGRVEHGIVSIVDLFPSLVDLAGLDGPEQLHGRSLAPLLRKGLPLDDQPVFMQLLPPKPHLVALRSDAWKYIVPEDGRGPPSLYDLDNDPGEHDDVAGAHPAVLRRLQEHLDQWRTALAPPPALTTIPLTDKEIEEQLRALGYVK